MGRSKMRYLLLCTVLMCLLPVMAFSEAYVSGGYTYTLHDGKAEITRYNGTETEIDLPSTLDGFPVTKIGPSVFSGKKEIIKITLPDGLTEIGTKALRGTGIREITLPESLHTLGDYALTFCKSLEAIKVPDTNKAFTALDGVLYAKDMSRLLAYPAGRGAERFVLPSSVKAIAKSAFYLCTLNEIILPENLERIDDEAFLGCVKLQKLDIPPSVTQLGKSAFEFCNELKTLTLPSGITQISERAFAACGGLETVLLPQGVTVIGKQAFYDSDLAFIDLPGSLREIGESAFGSCDNLTNIRIPKAVKTLGYKALIPCGQLQSIQVDVGNDAYSSLDGVLYNKAQTSLITYPIGKGEDRFVVPEGVLVIEDFALSGCFLYEIVIPEGVTHIGKGALRESMFLTSLSLPKSVIHIGEGALNYCDKLQSISVSANNPAYASVEGILYDKAMTELIVYPAQKTDAADFIVPSTVKKIGAAFMDNASLQSITLPKGLQGIGANAFFNCTGLTELILPSSVTSIDTAAFGQCKSLTKITLPAGITALPDYAFINCTSLKTLSIPKAVSSIGKYAFYQCEGLESIILPDTVMSIGDNAFTYCSRLASIIIPASVASIGSRAFSECPRLTIFGVPGSAAQTFALENGLPFEAVQP